MFSSLLNGSLYDFCSAPTELIILFLTIIYKHFAPTELNFDSIIEFS